MIIFVVLAGLTAVAYFAANGEGKIQTISGYVGGEKIGFLADPDVQKYMRMRYRIEVDYTKAGSIEMVREPGADMDFLFPSSRIALEIMEQENGDLIKKSERVFNSPIVLYSWDMVADALVTQGIASKQEGIYYIADMPELIDMVLADTAWADIGLPDIYGSIKIISTDPNKSNSGNMYCGLLSNILSGGVADASSLPGIIPDVKRAFAKLGMMESSSGTLFSRYLTRGVGDSPIIVCYENQIVEFALENPDLWDSVKGNVAMMYPEPTVWSEHIVIALNDNGKKLIEALQDPDIQRLAWEKHGFRVGPAALDDTGGTAAELGLPETITQVVPMPKADIMERLMDALLE